MSLDDEEYEEHVRNTDAVAEFDWFDDEPYDPEIPYDMSSPNWNIQEEELDEIYSREGTNKGYQRNRGGENTIRKMIKGNVDIDRTSLICFLIFFGRNTELSERNQINVKRLSTILHECGFNKLNPKDEFDEFIIGYLESDEPEDFLMEEVTRYAIKEQNFFLYQMYRGAVSYDEESRKVLV